MAADTPYSRLEQFLHHLAFRHGSVQEVMADIEESLFSKRWADIKADRPVFVTSLPRAGTTIVLEALFRLPGLATHTYRDMPFVMAPVLWERISGRFRRHSEQRERAHGDGLAVNEDSPEAFEEVLWQRWYPRKYRTDSIALWGPDDLDAEFRKQFVTHMRKIICLREPGAVDGRYISKNNANVARTALLRRMFPDAAILVPFRQPLEHAVSLWRQHLNFTRQHSENRFVLEYMGYIGHYEFGALHRPIAFPGLDELIEGLAPESLDYWLAYWIAGFRHLSEQEGVDFIGYESLCARPADNLRRMCGRLGIEAGEEAIGAAASVFRAPPAQRGGDHDSRADLRDLAHELHGRLLGRCVLGRG